MMSRLKKYFYALLLSSPVLSATAQDATKYVDPNIGTAHSRWFFYTPAALPHGMAKLAPSTNGHYGNPSGWEAVGYDTRHTSIEGFVHFHEWQVGGVSVMPATGPLFTKPGDLEKPDSGYRSRFDRKNEFAEPGYYKVLLEDYKVTAELTATKRVGFHQYTFPASSQSRILLDIGNKQGESGEVTDAAVYMTDDTHFEGFVITEPKYVDIYDNGGRVSMYFWGEVDKKPMDVNAFSMKGISLHTKAANGKGAGLSLEYKTTAGEKINLKIGLSYTSISNARLNFKTEAANLDFAQARKAAHDTWQNELGKLTVTTSDVAARTKFYTGLFHALLGRGVANDVNGAYPLHGGGEGHLPANKDGKFATNYMNTDAIWGGYWNLTQLWALSYPEHYTDFVQTELEMYKDRGWFGDGIANSNFVSGVGTNFVGLAIVGAYNAGIRNYNTNLAYTAIKANEMNWKNRHPGSGKMDVKAFMDKGYSPFFEGGTMNNTDSTGSAFSASHTLEYSFSAFAAAQMAKSLGKEADYKSLIQYSNGWKLLFDDKEKLVHPKDAAGNFIGKFDPYEPWRGFQEGNAMQYSFFVPQNPAGLIQAMGKDTFNNRLDNIFQRSQKDGFGGGKEIDAFAGIRSIYNHGNQPNLHISWLFNFSGKPWLTQKWTRAICNEFYGTEPIHGYGYGQDEDQGQLGSWYVMAALGLFDVKGFTDRKPIVQFGSPIFDNAAIKLGNGKRLSITTINNGTENVFIQSAKWNGMALNNCWMYRDELMKGGRLEFVMGKTPNTNWGVSTPPPSVQ